MFVPPPKSPPVAAVDVLVPPNRPVDAGVCVPNPPAVPPKAVPPLLAPKALLVLDA